MFNNPYTYGIPTMNRIGSLGGFFRSINWTNMLANTSKTLDVINQAIPIVNQVKPILNNAKTMFKIVSAFNSDEVVKNTEKTNNTTDGPIFFI